MDEALVYCWVDVPHLLHPHCVLNIEYYES